jgi:hypothetical protein
MKPNKAKLLALALLTLTASIASAKDVDQTCKDLLGKIGKSKVVGITRPDRLPPLARVTPGRPGRPGNGPFKPVLETDANPLPLLAGRYRTRSPGAGI